MTAASFSYCALDSSGSSSFRVSAGAFGFGSSNARTKNVDVDTLCRAAVAFCERIRAAGYQPMIYFNTYDGLMRYDLSQIKDYPFWLANYTETPDFYYGFQMWQYTSSGSVDGIVGKVDRNLYWVETP